MSSSPFTASDCSVALSAVLGMLQGCSYQPATGGSRALFWLFLQTDDACATSDHFSN